MTVIYELLPEGFAIGKSPLRGKVGVGSALGMMGNKPVARKRARLGGRSFGGVLSMALVSGIIDAKSRATRRIRSTELKE